MGSRRRRHTIPIKESSDRRERGLPAIGPDRLKRSIALDPHAPDGTRNDGQDEFRRNGRFGTDPQTVRLEQPFDPVGSVRQQLLVIRL